MSGRADKTQKGTEKQTQTHKAKTPNSPTTASNNTQYIFGRSRSPSDLPIRSGMLKPETILQLQRTIGNQAVMRVVGQSAENTHQRDGIEAAQQNDLEPEAYDVQAVNGSSERHQNIKNMLPGAQPLVQRNGEDTEDENVAWADNAIGRIESIQDAVSGALERLNADARTAIQHIRDSQTQYDNFDEMYESAVAHVVGGIEAAQAKEQEMRENVKFVATSILAVAAPTANSIYSAIDGTITKVQRVSSILATPSPSGTGSSGSSSPGMAARGENRVDWSELLSTTLDTFENTLQNNASLQNVANECVSILRFLDDVQEGRYTGANPRTDSNGQKADRMVNDASSILRDLRAIDEGIVSGPAETLKDQITERLSDVTPNKLRQDIAIRWMAGLGSNELDQIDTADAYLAEIGVFDGGDNRLDYDTGVITTDVDERILHWRAQWENLAMMLVGSTVTWLGNPFVPRQVIDTGTRCIEPRAYGGQVRDGRNREWNVNVPQGAPPEGGGQMLLVSYSVDHRDSSGWEWSYPADLRQQLRWEITFTGRPVGNLGGGAPQAGPVLNSPDAP